MEELQLIIFRINESLFGIDATALERIAYIAEAKKKKGLPSEMSYVIKTNEATISVLNLKSKFGMDNTEITDKSKILIIQKENLRYGIAVDEVLEIIKTNKDNLKDMPGTQNQKLSLCFDKVVIKDDSLIPIIDINRLIGE